LDKYYWNQVGLFGKFGDSTISMALDVLQVRAVSDWSFVIHNSLSFQVSPPGPSYICLGGFTVLVRSDSFRMHVFVAALADCQRSLLGGIYLAFMTIVVWCIC
jgi:hypothetical protein